MVGVNNPVMLLDEIDKLVSVAVVFMEMLVELSWLFGSLINACESALSIATLSLQPKSLSDDMTSIYRFFRANVRLQLLHMSVIIYR